MKCASLIPNFVSATSNDLSETAARLRLEAGDTSGELRSAFYHGLCRKIHVAGVLKQSYEGDAWGRPTSSEAVPSSTLALAVALLVRETEKSYALNLRLKWMNAALAGLDLYKRSNDQQLAQAEQLFAMVEEALAGLPT